MEGARSGKRVFISKKDHEQILNRFDPKNFKSNQHHYYNSVPCPLCKKHNPDGRTVCQGCTFRKFTSISIWPSGPGCICLLDDIVGGCQHNPLYMLIDSIVFMKSDKEDAMVALGKIMEFLKSIK